MRAGRARTCGYNMYTVVSMQFYQDHSLELVVGFSAVKVASFPWRRVLPSWEMVLVVVRSMFYVGQKCIPRSLFVHSVDSFNAVSLSE